jgi:hypothetical protein
VAFTNRAMQVSGVASGGAEGIDLFYTKVAAKDTPMTADWISCGYAGLSSGSSPMPFRTDCFLKGADQPSQVTGIAAVTYDCTVSGCDANPTPPSPMPSRASGLREGGDAIRVFGYDAAPIFGIEPAEAEATAGACQKLEIRLRDQIGQGISGQNIDLHLGSGPGEFSFCTPEGGTTSWRAPDTGLHEIDATGTHSHRDESGATNSIHVEAETPPNGVLVFGVTADSLGDMAVTAWLDRSDDDSHAEGEPIDSSLVHWMDPRSCTLVGTSGDDILTGTAEDDVICALAGADLLRGSTGNDVLYGDHGNDVLFGGFGRDLIIGGAGADDLRAGRGKSDSCSGGIGRDRFRGCEQKSQASGPVAPA